MEKIIFNVPNISCNHCVHTIEMELSEIEGVIQVDADAESKTVNVDFDDPATKQSLMNYLEEINYPATN
jgi:copper ion binding protein